MSARILLIEDHPANLELMFYLLDHAGYEVIYAENGLAGLELARHRSPDLILSDILLPGLDGFGILAALMKEERLAEIPVVAVTASAMAGDREAIIAAGFDDYISKPIEPETFVQQIERHLPEKLRKVREPTA
jgi:two-component system, cell cycle response regulator DivK